jgi:hypothetical protein
VVKKSSCGAELIIPDKIPDLEPVTAGISYVVAYRLCGGVRCGNCGYYGGKGNAAPDRPSRDRRDRDQPVACSGTSRVAATSTCPQHPVKPSTDRTGGTYWQTAASPLPGVPALPSARLAPSCCDRGEPAPAPYKVSGRSGRVSLWPQVRELRFGAWHDAPCDETHCPWKRPQPQQVGKDCFLQGALRRAALIACDLWSRLHPAFAPVATGK